MHELLISLFCTPEDQALPSLHRLLPAVFFVLLGVALALGGLLALAAGAEPAGGLSDSELDLSHANQPVLVLDSQEVSGAEEIVATAEINSTSEFKVSKHTISSGENLSGIFASLGFRAGDLANILIADQRQRPILETVSPGDELIFRVDSDGVLQQLDYYYNSTRFVRYQRRADSNRFDSEHHSAQLESTLSYLQGSINSSFYVDALASGLNAAQIMDMAQIFAYDIDFAYQLRPGDSFGMLYEQHYKEGAPLDHGPILLAEFNVGGKQLTAIRFVDKDGVAGYFTPEGKAMKTRFLRVPLEFTRISSGFSRARKHPILNVTRKHTGVDYVAPYRSEIFSVGQGTVEFIGRKGDYGNTLIIDHGDGYSTLYAHLYGFARGLKRGSRVQQQQVIGYLGNTGLSTGPHLHYEFRINGKHLDPQRVKLPRAHKLNKQELPEFLRSASAWQQRADLYKRVAQASGQSAIRLP